MSQCSCFGVAPSGGDPLDMEEGPSADPGKGHVLELDRGGRDKYDKEVVYLEKADRELLNFEEDPDEVKKKIFKEKKDKKSGQPVSTERHPPRGLSRHKDTTELSLGGRREKARELDVNKLVKPSLSTPIPQARYELEKRTAANLELNKHLEENRRPSLLELEIQALATLGFVKLQPESGLEAIAPSTEMGDQVLLLDRQRAGLGSVNTSQKQERPERDDLLELEKVALEKMKITEKLTPSIPYGSRGGDLLELQKLALAKMEEPQVPFSAHISETAVFLSPPQKAGVDDLLELQKAARANMTATLRPAPAPKLQQEESGLRGLLELEKATLASRKATLRSAAAAEPRPRPEESGRGSLLELEKAALLSMKATQRPAPALRPSQEESGVPRPPQEESGRGGLLELEKAALLSMKATPRPAPALRPSQEESGGGGLLELEKADLLRMKATPKPAPALKPSQQESGGAGGLLELEKAALVSTKATPRPAPALRSSQEESGRGDLMELEKAALVNMKASAHEVERVNLMSSKASAKSFPDTERDDLLELERVALANLRATESHETDQGDSKTDNSRTGKGEIPSSDVLSPSSSYSSFNLEPASGPLERLLLDLTSKDKALQVANKKLAEKDQLLQQYEGELGKALNMLESMSARCTDAKEETSKALTEVEGIYDDLNQAWCAVENLEVRSTSNARERGHDVLSTQTIKGNGINESQLEMEERAKWTEELLEELHRIELVREDSRKDFELKIQRNGNLIVELQQLEAATSKSRLATADDTDKCEHVYLEPIRHEDLHDSKSTHLECHHVFESSCETNSQPSSSEWTVTSEQLVQEKQKIVSQQEENQRTFQHQLELNQQILRDLRNKESHHSSNVEKYKAGKEYSKRPEELVTVTPSKPEQWAAERAELTARVLQLGNLEFQINTEKELNEHTHRVQRVILEEAKKLRKALKHKTNLRSDLEIKKAYFAVDTRELEAYVCSNCSTGPNVNGIACPSTALSHQSSQTAAFEGDTKDFKNYLCHHSSSEAYICSTCSDEPAIVETDLCSKETVDFEGGTADLETFLGSSCPDESAIVEAVLCSRETADFEGDTTDLETLICSSCSDEPASVGNFFGSKETADFEGDTTDLETFICSSCTDGPCMVEAAVCSKETADFEGDTTDLESFICSSCSHEPARVEIVVRSKETTDFEGDTTDLERFICSSCSDEPAFVEIVVRSKDAVDFEGDTTDLKSLMCSEPTGPTTRVGKSAAMGPLANQTSVKGVQLEKYAIEDTSQKIRNLEEENKELVKHLSDCQAKLWVEEDKSMKLRDSTAREEKAWQEERKELIKCLNDCEETLLVEESKIEKLMERMSQEEKAWQEEKKKLGKCLRDCEANLVVKEEKIGELMQKIAREESAWQEEKYNITKRFDDCETNLLAKDEELIELTSELEMARSSLQGFTDSSTLSSSDLDLRVSRQTGLRDASNVMPRLGRNEARELLDLRCEVLSLHECLVIKGEAIKTMEKELHRSYNTVAELRNKLRGLEETQRFPQTSQLATETRNGTHNDGPRLKGKVAKKPRILKDPTEFSTNASQNRNPVEKLRSQSERISNLEKERENLMKKVEELSERCKYLEGIMEELHKESSEDLKENAMLDLRKELERNVQIIQKMQVRCSEFEARAIHAESQLHLKPDEMTLGTFGAGNQELNRISGLHEEDASWARERDCLLQGLQYYREQLEKKNEHLYQLQHDLKKLRRSQKRQSPTPPSKSEPFITPQEKREEILIVDTTKVEPISENSQALACAPFTNARLQGSETRSSGGTDSQTLQMRSLREQRKLQCDMEDRLNSMKDHVSERVKEFEQRISKSVAPTLDFTHFHEEAKLMKMQLEQQLQVLRGTLSTSLTSEKKSPSPDITTFIGDMDSTRQENIQQLIEKVALEDSAQTLEEKTSRLLHKLTSTRLHWNKNMLAAALPVG